MTLLYDLHMRYRVALFDLDYTLFDSAASEREALEKSFRTCGLGLEQEIFTKYQIINKDLWSKLEKGVVTLDTLRVKRFTELLKVIGMEESVNSLHLADTYTYELGQCGGLLPGAKSLLEALSKELKLALVTNGVSQTQRSRIEKFDIAKYFQTVVISGEVNVAKPDRNIFAITLDKLGHKDLNSTIMIGDSLSSDIAGAENFGIDACWFNPGHIMNRTRTNPQYDVQSFDEIRNLLIGPSITS